MQRLLQSKAWQNFLPKVQKFKIVDHISFHRTTHGIFIASMVSAKLLIRPVCYHQIRGALFHRRCKHALLSDQRYQKITNCLKISGMKKIIINAKFMSQGRVQWPPQCTIDPYELQIQSFLLSTDISVDTWSTNALISGHMVDHDKHGSIHD